MKNLNKQGNDEGNDENYSRKKNKLKFNKENKILPNNLSSFSFLHLSSLSLFFFLFLFSFFSFSFAEERISESNFRILKWKYETEQTYSDVLVDGNKIFSVTINGSFYSFDRISGTKLWSREIGATVVAVPKIRDGIIYVPTSKGIYTFDINGNSRGNFLTDDQILTSPIFYEGLLIFVSSEGNIYVFDATKDLSKNSLLRTISLSIQTEDSAVAFAGKVFVFSKNGEAFSVDPFTGNKVKIASINKSIFKASPIVVNNSIIFVAENNIYAMTTSGVILWKVEFPAWLNYPNYDNTTKIIYVGSNDGNLYAITTEGNFISKFKAGDAIRRKVAITKRTIYIPSQDKNIYVIDKDMKLKWNFSLDDWPSSPILVNGTIYTITYNGTIYAISTMGCTIDLPKENGSVAAQAFLSGRVFADEGVQLVEVRTVPGSWFQARTKKNTNEEWETDIIISGFPEGPLPIQCRVTDNENNKELSPFAERMVNFVFSMDRLPEINVKYPSRVNSGEVFTLRFYDEKNNTLPNVIVLYKEATYKSDENGELILTAPSIEGKINLEANFPNYKKANISIEVGKSLATLFFYASGGIFLLAFIIYVYIKSRRWR